MPLKGTALAYVHPTVIIQAFNGLEHGDDWLMIFCVHYPRVGGASCIRRLRTRSPRGDMYGR